MGREVRTRWVQIDAGSDQAYDGYQALPPAGRGPGLVLFQECRRTASTPASSASADLLASVNCRHPHLERQVLEPLRHGQPFQPGRRAPPRPRLHADLVEHDALRRRRRHRQGVAHIERASANARVIASGRRADLP